MWLDNVNQDAVDLFWQHSGELEPFPRNLERPLALALPVTLVKLSRLRLRDVETWLQRRRARYHFACQSRAVRGCLLAFGGSGFIFVDGADPDDERRFTLAHEIAHFITDYWQPRHKAIAKFGPTIAEVVDGLRRPNVTERLHAVLTSIPIGVHTNLMERDEGEGTAISEVWKIEDRADRIALALLAPPEEVLSQADLSLARFAERQSVLQMLMREHFGLPTAVAHAYSWSLLAAIGKGPSWAEGLRSGS